MTKQPFQTLDTTATQQNSSTKSRYISTSYFSAFNSVGEGVGVGKEAYREHSHVVFCRNK